MNPDMRPQPMRQGDFNTNTEIAEAVIIAAIAVAGFLALWGLS